MKALDQLKAGEITPAQFVETVAADLKADVAKFNQIPGAQPFEAWAIPQIETALEGSLSPTGASLVGDALKAALAA